MSTSSDLLKPIGNLARSIFPGSKSSLSSKVSELINASDYISRDLSWIKFNYRVLYQAQGERSLPEKLRFLAITASNFDEFFMIRVGSLYNYIDFGKERVDYSGLREKPFRLALFQEAHEFYVSQYQVFSGLAKDFHELGLKIANIQDLTEGEKNTVFDYFRKTVYPMLTPMLLDPYHAFPVVNNKALTFGIVTKNPDDPKNPLRLTLLQMPLNLHRFYTIEREDETLFLPLEDIIRWQMDKLFRNIEIVSINLFRITRNGDITIEESDDEADFVDEVRRKLNNRRTGRVVRIEIEDNYSSFMMKVLKARWEIDYENIFICPSLLDLTSLFQLVKYPDLNDLLPATKHPVFPLSHPQPIEKSDMFELLKQKDILLHHPYNNMEPLLALLEQAADDPGVLSIKMTIYRLAKDSRIIAALHRAAENGKYVSALFEVKARFDEENNIREAKRLQKAGCFVIYGVGRYKTHTKLLQIVRKEDDKVTRYNHLGSGNYNEDTSRLYSDISLLTTNEVYANDVSEFFNVITGHSVPDAYQNLITAPREMRDRLVELIAKEAATARLGRSAGIVIKVNSLEDKAIIDALYEASQAGVTIKLIVRGMCCLRPGRKGLSENITVRSVVGDFLEHTRLFYFHNEGQPLVYGGSADLMNRSFDRRIEGLFRLVDAKICNECIHILQMNLSDNQNAFELMEDGHYYPVKPAVDQPAISVHEYFYQTTPEAVALAQLF